jgi:pimeloyl-ACP methyl ester carboxylesterase
MDAILLPGGIMPAELAYADLLDRFDADVDAVTKELEVYAEPDNTPPHGYTWDTEIAGIDRVADGAGFGRFHLVGYSAGGAVSLAYALAHSDRLVSLTLAEPAWAGTEARTAEEADATQRPIDAIALPPEEMLPTFIRSQLEEGVEPPPTPDGPPPAWMRSRPPGAAAMVAAFQPYPYPAEAMRAFRPPVLFVLGGRSRHAYYGLMAERLGSLLPAFSLVTFPERHHFDPPHRAEPERYARVLEDHWRRAETLGQD